ncbi:MAG TPA: hypothetical protein VHM65_11080 [Candidatus Lustribacter sp.]|nr:hypothetical protein [Candidatus Lustribacter sp.]
MTACASRDATLEEHTRGSRAGLVTSQDEYVGTCLGRSHGLVDTYGLALLEPHGPAGSRGAFRAVLDSDDDEWDRGKTLAVRAD